MYNFLNSCTLYVSQTEGSDERYSNGFAPKNDGFGNGPFKTLERALRAVGELRVTGVRSPITIRITDDYFVSSPIQISSLTTRTSSAVIHGVNTVTIESFGGRRRIIGGMKIEGWREDVFNGVKCISATVPKGKDGENRNFSELFVNGRRADRTRYPKDGTLTALKTETDDAVAADDHSASAKWFMAKTEDLCGITNIENATVSFYHYWIDEHSPVESYDAESGKLVMKYATRKPISTIYGPEESTSALHYYLENIPSAFSNPGEWYFDAEADKIYYIPTEDCPLDLIEAYVPTVDKLFKIYGSAEHPIFDIRLHNLELMCTGSHYVSRHKKVGTKFVFCEDAAFASDRQSACDAYGTISFSYASRCSIENCTLHGLGVHAVDVSYGCHGIRIENNKIFDIGAGGIKIDGGDSDSEQIDRTYANVIRGNLIKDCGRRIAAGCGILVRDSCENEISGNEICYLDYSGISVGWVWGYDVSVSYGNRITGNHIHHIGMGRLSDLGGVYLLGNQQGTIVSENLIHDIKSAHYGGWGIYLDEGSSFITVERNTVYRTKCSPFNLHYGSQNVVRNNIFAFGGEGGIRILRNETHAGVLLEENIILLDGTTAYASISTPVSLNSRNNIYYDISGSEPMMWWRCDGGKYSLSEWQNNFGKDTGSVIADPMFKNPQEGDFTLDENSPAKEFGF